jgi:hypothetical protein
MKTKIQVSEKAQSITTKALWLIILAIVAFTLLSPTKVKAETLNALEVKEMPRNASLKKYHKMQKRMERNVFKPAKRKRK